MRERDREKFQGADITNVCRDAAMMGLRARVAELSADEIRALSVHEVDLPISTADFQLAIRNTSPSVSSDDINKYGIWMNEFGAA